MKRAYICAFTWCLSLFLAPYAFARGSSKFDSFVPEGWTLFSAVEGDLNGDGQDDAVLVIVQNDPKNIKENTQGLGNKTLNENPRRLVILFQSQEGYAGVHTHDTIIPPEGSLEDPCQEDPFQKIAIKDGKLMISFHYFNACGSWWGAHHDEIFRYEITSQRFRRIGTEEQTHHRGTTQEEYMSFNYLTGRKKTTTKDLSDPTIKDVVIWEKISENKPIYLDDMS